MIPFALFTRTILDSGIVRVLFTNVQWVDNGDGTYYYDIPRVTHLSGIYPKTIISNTNGKYATGMYVNYLLNGTVRLITTIPLPNFTGYFLGDNNEVGGAANDTQLLFRTQLYSNDDYCTTPSVASAYQDPTTKIWYGAGKRVMFGLSNNTNDLTNGWEEFSSKLPAPIKDIQFGGYCTLALLEDGRVFGVGSNGDSRLSNIANTFFNVWTDLGVSNVVQIAPGYAHNIVRKSDGTIMLRGRNMWGALGGSPSADGWYRPTFSGVVSEIRAQWNTSYAKVDSTWMVAGVNSYGQTGESSGSSAFRAMGQLNGQRATKVFPGLLKSTYAINGNGNVYYSGAYINTSGASGVFVPVTGLPNDVEFVDIVSDDKGAVAYTKDKRVFMCGGSSTANSNYTTTEMTQWREITDDIGQQLLATRCLYGTFIFNGSQLMFSGDNTGHVTGTTGTYNTFSDIPINV